VFPDRPSRIAPPLVAIDMEATDGGPTVYHVHDDPKRPTVDEILVCGHHGYYRERSALRKPPYRRRCRECLKLRLAPEPAPSPGPATTDEETRHE
jgi:hypothetical protein